MRNHTATHLLNWALRKVLGEHVEQKGSLVDAEKTRFDFTHDKPLSAGEIAQVERLVNEKIYADLPVTAATMPLAEAKKMPGVRAVFGEKYPDPVRVLLIGARRPEDATDQYSVEFCGGTHLKHTGQAGFFKIVSQEGVGKGVRRVTAVTGREAVATVQRLSSVVDDLAGRFNCKPEDLPRRVEALQEEVKKLQTSSARGRRATWPGPAIGCWRRRSRPTARRSSSARCRPRRSSRCASRSTACARRREAPSWSSAGPTRARSGF